VPHALFATALLLATLPKQAALDPRLAEAHHDLFEASDAPAAAAAADAFLAGNPHSREALELSYVAHWMLDDEAVANQRFLDLVALGGPEAPVYLLDGWERLRTSREEGRRIAEEARKLLPEAGALRGPVATLLGRVALMAGDIPAARAAQDPLGRLTRWQIIGPFENDQNSGYDVPYPPEKGVDLAASYPGKQAKVSWRELPGAGIDGRICLDCVIYPSVWGVAYLATWVHVDGGRDAVLRAEADDHLKVWVNGRLALADDTAREMATEQHLAGIHLHAGWNQVLAKVAQRTGPWTLGIRITDDAGAALPGLASSASPHPFAPARAAEPWLAAPKDAALAILESHPDLAVPPAYLEAWRLFDLGYFRKARAAFEVLKTSAPRAAVYAYGAALSALHDEDRDHGLSGLAEAVRLDPGFLRARTERGEVYLGMRLAERSEEQAKAALARAPLDPLALDLLAQLRAQRGYEIEAEALLEREEKAHPGLAGTALRRAEAARSQGEPLRALDLFREAHHRDLEGWEATEGIVEIQEQLGHLERARAALEDRRLSRPQDVVDLGKLARLAAAYRRDGEARRWIAEAEALCPQWDDPYRVAGYLSERAGDVPAALTSYREALARDPSDPTLRDQIELLDPAAQLADRYEVSHDEILKRAAAARPDDYPGADGVVLLAQEIVRLNSDGSSRHWVQFAAKVFDQVGADRYLNRHVGEPENFKLLYAGTIDPDGLERESSSRDGAVLHFPAPAPGSVVALRYSYDEPRASATQDDWWGYYAFGNLDPAIQERWVVIAPKDRALHVHKRGQKLIETDETIGDESVRTFEEKDVPKLETEPSAPPWVDVQDEVFASTLPSWDRVASFVHAVVDDQVIDDDTVRDQARALCPTKLGAEAEVAALARFVAKEIRYAQADTGVYSWRPHPAGRVLASRYGDCKDKATLFIALARQLGLRAEFAALRTRQAGAVHVPVPVTWYNHAIVYLPAQKGIAKGRFLDLTADDLGSTYLPFSDQGVEAMVIDPGKPGFRFVDTPFSPDQDDTMRAKGVVRLSSDGSARAKVDLTAAGLAAMAYRAAYRNPTSRRHVMDFLAGRWLFEGGTPVPGSVSAHGLEDLTKPLELDLDVAAPEVLRRSGDALLLRPGGFPHTDFFSQHASRKLPLVLDAKNLTEVAWEYDLPTGVAVAQLPTDLHLDNRFFSFDADYKSDGGKIFLTTRYRAKVVEVAAADYEALRDAMLEVARAGEREIVLRAPPAMPAGR